MDEGPPLPVGLSRIPTAYRRPSSRDAFTEEKAAMSSTLCRPRNCCSGTSSSCRTRATLLSTKLPTRNTIVETRQMEPGVYLGQTLLPPEHRDLRVSIVNTTAEPRTVAVGEWLGNLHNVEVLSRRTVKLHPQRPRRLLEAGSRATRHPIDSRDQCQRRGSQLPSVQQQRQRVTR